MVIPIRWGDMDAMGHVAKHYVANPRPTSFEAYVTLERTDEPDVLYATGGAKTVWVNHLEERSVPLPEAVKALVG